MSEPSGWRHEEGLETIANMVGNAFDIHNFAPFNMSLLTTWGRHKHGCAPPSEPSEVADESESCGESSDT